MTVKRNATRCPESGKQIATGMVPRKTKVRCGCGKLLSLSPNGSMPLHNKDVRRGEGGWPEIRLRAGGTR